MCGTWTVVETVGDEVELRLTMDREIGAFGQVLAQQAVRVFASAHRFGVKRVFQTGVVDVEES
jgi:hypothetical protein